MEYPKVNVIIVNYNGKSDLEVCLISVLNQTYPNYDITVVDNNSTDGSVEYIKNRFPKVKVIENSKNAGYGEGNNIGIKATKGDYVAILNYDVEVDQNWISELIKALKIDKSIQIATSKILMYDDKEMINTCGNVIHYTGLVFCRGIYKNALEFNKKEPVASTSGCSFVISRKVFEELTGFDVAFGRFGSAYSGSLEDTDLAWRAQLRGYRVIFVPSSVVYHKYKLKFNPKKYFYVECGRYLFLLKNFSCRTFVVLIPALLLTEILTWGYAIIKGPKFMKAKIQAYLWLFKNYREVLIKRRENQRLRKIKDSELFIRLTPDILFDQLISNSVSKVCIEKIINLVFRVHYSISYYLIKR